MKTESKLKTLTKHLMIMNQELYSVLTLLDEKKEARAGAILGGRVQIISTLFEKFNKGTKFRNMFNECVQDLNNAKKKIAKEEGAKQDQFTKEISEMNYMG